MVYCRVLHVGTEPPRNESKPMPWHIAQSSSCPADRPYAVIKDSDGSIAGCHPTEDAAKGQLAALYASEANE